MTSKINPMTIPGLSSIEEIAASVWEIEVNDLYLKTRKREVVEARQSLMNFRMNVMRQKPPIVAKKYNQHRCTALHAMKTVKDLNDTDNDFRGRYADFSEKARKVLFTPENR
jgi:chromosomal replication initiator protein